MKITLVGAGYVGLVSGACFATVGHDVTCFDKDQTKIQKLQQGIMPIHEKDLNNYVAQGVRDKKLHFSNHVADSIKHAEMIFIAVGTPSRRGMGHADLRYIFEALDDIIPFVQDHCVIVTKSTVPVGTNQKIDAYIKEKNPHLHYHVVSNPEFLREGVAIYDFMNPDRILIGASDPQAFVKMRQLYAPFIKKNIPLLEMNLESAELAKYAANSFLAMKISFINEIADLCEKTGANITDIATAMGKDKRIGADFLKAGPGYGGSCFPKDTKALVQTAHDHDIPLRLVETTIYANEKRFYRIVTKIEKILANHISGKKIAIWGLAFKAGTDDLRDSPSLKVIELLQEKGASITAHDPEAIAPADLGIVQEKCPYKACDHADLLLIMTEWEAFLTPDWTKVKQALKTPAIMDCRTLYAPHIMRENGFDYHAIGLKED